MLDYFVNKKELQKLTLFSTILLSKNGITSKELIANFSLNEGTFRRHIKELRADLSNLFDTQISLIENHSGQLEVLVKSPLRFDQILTSLKLSYIKNSSLYILVSALIKNNYESVYDIAYDLNFSEPTVYKLLTQVKDILQPFNADIDLDHAYNFKGDELGVRFFLYLTYWHFFNTIENKPFSAKIPLEFLNINEIKKNLNITKELTATQEKKIILMSGIICYRIAFFNKYADLDDALITDITPLFNNKIALKLDSYSIPDDSLEKEAKLFSFLVRALIYDIDSEEEKKRIVTNFQETDLFIAKDISAFLEYFATTFVFSIPLKNHVDSYYILIFIFIYSKHLLFDVDSYLTIQIENNKHNLEETLKYNKLKPTLEVLLNHFPNSENFSDNQTETFLFLLYILYKINSTLTPAKIYVSHTMNIVNPIYIKDTLSKFFDDNLICFCDSFEEADIIISSSSENNKGDKRFFYIENLYDRNSWKDLFSFLSDFLFSEKF